MSRLYTLVIIIMLWCRMNLNLRLVSGSMLQHKVDAPCSGYTAKALGKYKLEEETGLSVKFVSYQEAPGRQEVQLAGSQGHARSHYEFRCQHR